MKKYLLTNPIYNIRVLWHLTVNEIYDQGELYLSIGEGWTPSVTTLLVARALDGHGHGRFN